LGSDPVSGFQLAIPQFGQLAAELCRVGSLAVDALYQSVRARGMRRAGTILQSPDDKNRKQGLTPYFPYWGRRVVVAATVSAGGELCVRGEVVAVQVPSSWVPKNT